MTTKTIAVGSDRVNFDLGIGSYTLQAYGGKYLTVEQEFSVTQSDIETGSMEIDLGSMEAGTHTFNITVSSEETGEFSVAMQNALGETVDTATTVNKQASFTVTAADNDVDSVDTFTFVVTRNGFKTVSETADADVDEYRAGESESVTISAGSNVMTLTVIVDADAAVTVKVE